MPKNFSSKEQEKMYRQDILSFRMSALFILAVIMTVVLFNLRSSILRIEIHSLSRNHTSRIVASCIPVLPIVWFLICKLRKVDESLRLISSANVVCVVTYICALFLYWGTTYHPLALAFSLTLYLPLLYFIYNMFEKDFFVFSLSNFVFASALYLTGITGLTGIARIIVSIAAGVALSLSAFMCYHSYYLSKKFTKNKKYKYTFTPAYISFVLTIVFVSLSNVMNITFVNQYKWYAFAAQYIIFAIYYIIKFFKGE